MEKEVKAKKAKLDTRGTTYIKGTGLSGVCENSHVACVDVKDNKILRIRPLHYDWRYSPEHYKPWKIEARGKTFQPTSASALAPFGVAYKKRVQSPNRILYPLKRVDWDPDGERNPQNRGISKYERISWDEALNILVKELKRIWAKYGMEAVFCQGDGHGETKIVGGGHGTHIMLLDLLGGYTLQVRNPDSWEGWYWGAKHIWGMEPIGLQQPYNGNVFPDILKNSGTLLYWGCDAETTPWGFGSCFSSRICYQMTEVGVKQIFICPDVNYAGAVHADKWIPVLPNTDAALQLAIAYQWIVEDTYDKEYIKTHAIGFEKFKDYVLGKEDGIAKTPEWAATKCGVPSRVIKALARRFAKTRTSIAHGLGGPYIRGPYSTEPARLEVVLLAMQGLGKPGVNQVAFIAGPFPAEVITGMFRQNPMPQSKVIPKVAPVHTGYIPFLPMPKQMIPKHMVHDAILDGKFTIYGSSQQMYDVIDQFIKYEYPAPGCSPIHMIWSDTPCLMTCWNDSNQNAVAYQHESIETIVVQHPWLENDCLFADLLLPVNTKFEEEDIGDDNISYQYDTIYLEHKCIDSIGESKSDYEIAVEVADRLGVKEKFTKGQSIPDKIKEAYEISGIADLISWEEFNEKQYFVAPTDPDWEKWPAGLYEFYKDPINHPIQTPTGKLEIEATLLAKHFPDDKERPPIPKWIEKCDWHDERIGGERHKKYPLLCQSNHPKWRIHAQLDDVTWFHEIPTSKIIGPDGYHYEPMWIHPIDAKARGIRQGDIVKGYNERGAVLFGARVTERIMPGVVYVDHGARYDPIVVGGLDRGGAVNTLTPHKLTSKKSQGMVTNGFLVEVERANLDELRRQYPEAFNRPIDRASGLVFERVLAKQGGKQ
jgi:trimethylamine-N-oxide reductase (cytochrome c)